MTGRDLDLSSPLMEHADVVLDELRECDVKVAPKAFQRLRWRDADIGTGEQR